MYILYSGKFVGGFKFDSLAIFGKICQIKTPANILSRHIVYTPYVYISIWGACDLVVVSVLVRFESCMALFKYLRREGPVCEWHSLSKETEQVNECILPPL